MAPGILSQSMFQPGPLVCIIFSNLSLAYSKLSDTRRESRRFSFGSHKKP